MVGAQNSPQLEATETLSTGNLQAGQSSTFNVTIANKGNGVAFNVKAAGLTKAEHRIRLSAGVF